MSRAGDDAEPGVDGGGAGDDAVGGVGDVDVALRAVLTRSLAMLLPDSTALLSTDAARFMNPTVSAMALADTFPARSLSSIDSVKRVNAFAPGD